MNFIKKTNNIQKNILLWSKKLRQEIPFCPLKISLFLSKILFNQEEDKFIFKVEDFPNINFEWLKNIENSETESIYFEYEEPNSPFLGFYMFGEDKLSETYEKNLTDIMSQVLDLTEEDKKEKVFNLMQQLLELTQDSSYDKII